MIEIGDKIVSAELFFRKFCCDLSRCKGTCCVEGDSGAPVEPSEEDALKRNYKAYSPYMTEEGRKSVSEYGFAMKDQDGDLVTPLVAGRECAYSYNEGGITKCAVEKAFLEGRSDFRKPVSCHLYPIREVKLSNGMTGLQFHEWEVCEGAAQLGEKLGLPAFRMLREPIVFRYGKEFYDALEQVESELLK